MTTLHSVSKLALWTADKISWKKAICSFSLVGAYKLSSRNGDSWMVISNNMYRPSSSITILFISYCSCPLIRTSTPLLWFEHPIATKFLRFYFAASKKFLQFPGLKLKRPAIRRKKNFLTQKEVLARALFLGCSAVRQFKVCYYHEKPKWKNEDSNVW